MLGGLARGSVSSRAEPSQSERRVYPVNNEQRDLIGQICRLLLKRQIRFTQNIKLTSAPFDFLQRQPVDTRPRGPPLSAITTASHYPPGGGRGVSGDRKHRSPRSVHNGLITDKSRSRKLEPQPTALFMRLGLADVLEKLMEGLIGDCSVGGARRF